MSKSLKFWLWTIFSLVVFGLNSIILSRILGLLHSTLVSLCGAILLWIIGLRLIAGRKRPLPRKKLRRPETAEPEEFELLCAEIYKCKGFSVELTPKGGDFGIDAIAKKRNSVIAIGAKCYAKDRPVGNRWVQQLLGARHKCGAESAVLITTSFFTNSALKQAENAPITLIDGEELKKIIKELWL